MVFGRSNRPLPPGEGNPNNTSMISQQESLASLSELNGLLESALRMSGEDAISMLGGTNNNNTAAPAPTTTTATYPPPPTVTDDSESTSSSWRLDTTRKLTAILSSNLLEGTDNNKYANELLLPTLQKQSRYWIPLLLGWLRQDDERIDNIDLPSSLDRHLPLTSKRIRQLQKKDGGSGGEVTVEVLKALALWSEWDLRTDKPSSTTTTTSTDDGDSATTSTYHVSNPHKPMHPSCQKRLMQQPDAMQMLVSLLSSPLLTSAHEHLIWIVGSLSSSGINCPSTANNNNSVSSRSNNNSAATAAAAAAEVTKAMKSSTSGANANSNSADVSVSMPAASAAADLDDDSNHKEKSSSSSVSARDAILAAGVMPPLLKILESDTQNLPLQRIGAWCLSSMVEGRYSNSSNDSSSSGSAPKRKYPDAEDIDILSLLTTLRRMLQVEDDEEILGFTCWALSHLCDGPAYHIAAVIYETDWTSNTLPPAAPQNGIIPRLIELLLHSSPKVAKPALRTIGNCVCAECTAPDNDSSGRGAMPVVDYTEVVLEYDAVPRLRELIDHEHREIQKEACWTLSNIAAGTPSQIQAVIDSGAIPPLVNLVNNENTDKEVRSEACWVVLNATSCGNDEQIDILINEGCVSVLGVLLTEASMVMMALEGLERVLQMEGNRDSNEAESGEEGTGHQTIVKCAELIQSVIKSPHHSSAVLKRAKRVWGTHIVACALCEKYYSVRLLETHWCSECKCHVCRRCNCAVYHLSYQEELWAEDEDKQEAKKNAKKSKKAKKKEKEKAKKEKKRLETQQQAAAKPSNPRSAPSSKSAKTKDEDGKSGSNSNESGKAMSSSRGSIDDDTDYGMDGGDAVQDEVEVSSGQPPIDLVSYLQQTGSIIALAKLMDSLYENEDIDEVANEQPNVDVKQRALATQ
mmetsp:Transcript_4007/g.6856  ORF Transcript_4007/g.6856 Transcript_4007/m.6856 type:complete len:916 (-) Transcript_4007:1084-3831(-)